MGQKETQHDGKSEDKNNEGKELSSVTSEKRCILCVQYSNMFPY